MARYHGRKGKLYMSTSGSGTATPVASLTEWSLDSEPDTVEVTAFGDNNKQYVQGLKSISGSFSGFWDDSEDKLFQALESSTAVKVYLYPSVDAPSKYWYGTAWVGVSVKTGVGDAVAVSGKFSAGGDWGRV